MSAENGVMVKRAIAGASRQRVLVCDAAKYDRVAAWLALPLSKFDQIITNDGSPESASRALAEQNLPLLVARNEQWSAVAPGYSCFTEET